VDVFLIDEVGKMELLCTAFGETAPRLLDGPVPIVMTVAEKGQELIAQGTARADVRLVLVNDENRCPLPRNWNNGCGKGPEADEGCPWPGRNRLRSLPKKSARIGEPLAGYFRLEDVRNGDAEQRRQKAWSAADEVEGMMARSHANYCSNRTPATAQAHRLAAVLAVSPLRQ
jgi:NTPase